MDILKPITTACFILFFGSLAFGQLSGNYTIDSASSTSGTNFQSFADLTNALSNQGVSGAVVVDVAVGSGPYNEQVIFDGYAGLSSSNTITINGQGERIHFNPSTGFSDKRIVGFDDGAEHIILDSLYITGNYGFGIGFDDNTQYITVRKCTVKMSNTGNWFQCAAIGSTNCPRPAFSCTQGSNASNITIENNTILGSANSGSFNAIYFINRYSSRAVNNIIRNNTISGFVSRGIYANNQDSLLIENNKISKPFRKMSGASYGITYSSDTSSRGVRIVRNEIFNLNGGKIGYTSSGTFGIEINASGSNNYPIKVQNNVIYELNRTVGNVYGIQTESNRYIEIINNSILLDDQVAASSTNTIGIYLKKAKEYQRVINNNIKISRKNFGSNYGISIEDSLTNSVVDYNNIFLSSKNANKFYGRIGSAKFKEILDWRLFNNGELGVNSFSKDPLYTVNNNLTPRAEFLNNSGLKDGIEKDFYGINRDSIPDIGAIEFGCGVPELAFGLLDDSTISLKLDFIGDSTRSWQIDYDTLSFSPDSGSNRLKITTWDTTISNLHFNKNYSFYIRSICQYGDTGYWSDEYLFRTTGKPLGGNYTIDSSRVTSGLNFQSFIDLTSRLEISGISDSVIVDVVKGSGPYNQQVIFESIVGLDSLSPLIVNGNRETLMFSPNTADYRILGFDNVSNIIIDSLIVKNLHQNYGFNIHLKNKVEHITIKNSIIDFSSITQPYSNSVGIFADNGSSSASFLKILNNTVKGNVTNGVFSAIILRGGSSSVGNEISGNSIQNFTTNGIYAYNQKNLVIKDNEINNNVPSYPSLSGINISGGNSNNITIENNIIEKLSLTNASYNHFACGVRITSNISSLQNPIVVKNNIIKEIFSDRDQSGMRINGSGVFQIYHNTLYLNDTINNQGNLSGIYYESNALAPEIYNNIVSLNKGGGGNSYSYYFKGGANSIKSGNNSFYFGTSGTGTNYVCRKSKNYSTVLYRTLLDWQNSGSITYDVNTIIENPEFVSDSILRPTNFVLKSGGINLEISEDYYGMSRDKTPDIGAVNLDTFNYPYYPIKRIVTTDSLGISDSLNIYCKTTGTVASIDFDSEEGKEFYIIDQQNDIQRGIAIISNQNISNYSVSQGDSIIVTGQILQNNGQIAINPIDIELISDSAKIITPLKVNKLLDSLESTLIKLEDLKLLVKNDSSDYLLRSTNSNNDTIYIRIDSDTDINDSLNIAGFAMGDSICSIVGIVSQYDTIAPFNTGYRLLPSYFSKIDTISCVQTDFELAQKDTLTFNLNNCADSVFFKYTLQNLNSHPLSWKAYELSDTIKEDFENGLKLFWDKSKGVALDTTCESVNGTVALTFRGKSGLRYLESHPISLTCKNNLKLKVKKAISCDSTSYSTLNDLRLQYSFNYGVTWKTLKTITASGNYDVPLIDKTGLLKFRIVQFASSSDSSQIWVIDDFSIEPNSTCSESISYLKASSTILSNNNYDLSGFISTQNKDSGSVYTTIPVYAKDSLRKAKYLTLRLNYDKNICPEFYFEQLGCGSSYKFRNISTGENLTYYWDFGDVDTSTLASPNHFYDSIGSYQVKMVACDSLNCDSVAKLLRVTNNFGPQEPPCGGVINNNGWGNSYFSITYVKIGPDTIYPYINNNYSQSHSIDHTCETRTHLQVKKRYKIRGSGSAYSPYGYTRYQAWIDYNNDGFLSQDERIMATNNGTSGDAYFTAPDTAVKNIPLRLRMIAFSGTSTYPRNNNLVDCKSSVPHPSIARDFTIILSDTILSPLANFKNSTIDCGYQVEFTSTSLYNPDTYSWDFGDGESSSEAGLIHTYKKPGSYEVTLIVENKLGSDTITKTVVVSHIFSPKIIGKYLPYCALRFLVQDSVKYKSLSWDFGNNDNATGANVDYAYKAGGTYSIKLTSLDTVNCLTEYKDTISILDLADTVVTCDSFTWIDGVTHTESDNAIQYVFATDSIGCDSIKTLNLTINKSSLQRDTMISCDQYLWPLNRKLYTQPGIYIDTVPTIKGCDSIGILNLSIAASSSLIDSITRCDSYYWSQTGKTYFKTGVYIDTLINAVGCDSLRTLNLIIKSTLSIDSFTVFDSLFWSQTGLTYYSSGLYTDTLTNKFGCDSILGIQLKINSSDAARISISQSKNEIKFSVCNNDSASFNLKIRNLGDIDTLFWKIEDLDNGLYFDNFENGFKSSLWQKTSKHIVVEGCGTIYGRSSLKFVHHYDRSIETYALNTTSADSLFFVYKNNSNCGGLVLGDHIEIWALKNNSYRSVYYSGNISHYDSLVHVGIALPSYAKGSNVKFKIEIPTNFSRYPNHSDISIDNFRIGGVPDSLFTPFITPTDSGFILPLDSQALKVKIDRSALIKGWQNSKLYIKSNDSLIPKDSISMPFLLDGNPCGDFTSNLAGCKSEVQFNDLSLGSPDSSFWDFGDSTFSSETNPNHSYRESGIYSVVQVVCSSYGCDTTTKSVSANSILKPIEIACDVSRNSWQPIGISYVSIGSISNISGFIPYEDYTCLRTDLDRDTTHILNVTTNDSRNSIWAYIDFNNDATFDSSEKIVFSPGSLNHTDTFAIPSNAVINQPLRMRIGSYRGGSQSPNLLTGCNTFSRVQYEDYTVFVQSSSSRPFAQFNSQKNICDDTIVFKDLSLSYPSSWHWSFGDDSTSNLQHPSHKYSAPGVYTVKLIVNNQNGSDSLEQLIHVTDLIDLADSIEANSCNYYNSPSGKYSWTSSGKYTDSLKSNNGCDSLVYINLTISTNTVDSSTRQLCKGDSALIFGVYRKNAGLYIDSLQSLHGCDSIIKVYLAVDTPIVKSSVVSICEGDSALIFSSYQKTAAIYNDTLQNRLGCDSIIQVQLLVNPVYMDTSQLAICEGDSAFIYGRYYYSEGTYKDTMQSSFGCDSILLTSLTIDSIDKTIQNNSPLLISNATNVSYQWLNCTSNYSVLIDDTLKSFIAPHAGNYAVQLKSGNCIDTSQCVQVLNVSVDEYNITGSNFVVFPNPNNGQFFIQISAPNANNSELSVFSSKGKIVSSKTIYSKTQKVKLEELSNGVYYIKYDNHVKKIIIIEK